MRYTVDPYHTDNGPPLLISVGMVAMETTNQLVVHKAIVDPEQWIIVWCDLL